MAYPTGDDLQAYMINAGLIETLTNDALDYEGHINAAVEAWESETGYRPFLNDGTASTRLYDVPDGSILDLRGGLLQVTGAFTLDGRALTAGVDYDLYPYNCLAEGLPAVAVQFRYNLDGRYAQPKAISLTGKFGYCSVLPDTVKLALLAYASFNILPTVSSSVASNGTITQIRQDDVTISYGGNSSSNQYSSVQLQQKGIWDKTLMRYRRLRFV